jgi:lipid-binding SYLF domain-containing protein
MSSCFDSDRIFLIAVLNRSLSVRGDVAQGPIGRNAAASTDVKLSAEILSYSRSKGIFAGVSLDGAVVQSDKSGDQSMYGANADRHDIVDGKVRVPASARNLLRELDAYGGGTSGA